VTRIRGRVIRSPAGITLKAQQYGDDPAITGELSEERHHRTALFPLHYFHCTISTAAGAH
jgi:hypothetical protein